MATAHAGGRCYQAVDSAYHAQLSRELAPDAAVRVLLHELGHIAQGHVAAPDALAADPPALLRAAWAARAEDDEEEAAAWAAQRLGADDRL